MSMASSWTPHLLGYHPDLPIAPPAQTKDVGNDKGLRPRLTSGGPSGLQESRLKGYFPATASRAATKSAVVKLPIRTISGLSPGG